MRILDSVLEDYIKGIFNRLDLNTNLSMTTTFNEMVYGIKELCKLNVFLRLFP